MRIAHLPLSPTVSSARLLLHRANSSSDGRARRLFLCPPCRGMPAPYAVSWNVRRALCASAVWNVRPIGFGFGLVLLPCHLCETWYFYTSCAPQLPLSTTSFAIASGRLAVRPLVASVFGSKCLCIMFATLRDYKGRLRGLDRAIYFYGGNIPEIVRAKTIKSPLEDSVLFSLRCRFCSVPHFLLPAERHGVLQGQFKCPSTLAFGGKRANLL